MGRKSCHKERGPWGVSERFCLEGRSGGRGEDFVRSQSMFPKAPLASVQRMDREGAELETGR